MLRVLFVILLFALSACKRPSIGYNDGYMPEQPIPYNHELHAGTYKIPCLYCHAHVSENKHSPVPSLNICMNCHKGVKTDSPLIKKVAEAYEKGESIPWVKVHMLPDFVRFNHGAHYKHFKDKLVVNGESKVSEYKDYLASLDVNPEDLDGVRPEQISCYVCHGRIDQMVEVYQHSDLSMGWCVNCHRREEHNAPVNCSTCHY